MKLHANALGLLDLSSAPLSIPHRTSEGRIEAIASLRRLRFTGPEIAECLEMTLSTGSGILDGSRWASSAGSASSQRSAMSGSAPAQTNGKAERFIRTLLGSWADGAIYRNSTERTAAVDGWLWHYNHLRKHSALGHHPPITRVTNLLEPYT